MEPRAGALFTDAGESIRQPSAFCDLVGLKPTYGRVPAHDAVAMKTGAKVTAPAYIGFRSRQRPVRSLDHPLRSEPWNPGTLCFEHAQQP